MKTNHKPEELDQWIKFLQQKNEDWPVCKMPSSEAAAWFQCSEGEAEKQAG